MATIAAHPFIRGGTLHGARIEPTRVSMPTKVDDEPEEEYEIELPPIYRRPRVVLTAFGGVALAAVAAVGAMNYGAVSGGSDQASAQTVPVNATRVDISGPKIVNGQLPEDYPGIYPGEQIVIYHLAPLVNEKTIEEVDDSGCTWLRIPDKTSGIRAYPKIGADDRQVCTDPSKAVVPLQARMIPDRLPQVDGSTLRIIDIIDAKTGSSQVAKAVPPIDSMIGMGGPDQAELAVADLPSQRAPARQVAISTAADAGSRPPAPTASAQPAVQRTVPQRQPRQLEPIRRAEPYVPPADDVMVPISDSSNGQRELHAIRPGDQPAATNPRRDPAPNGSPLEGYASISGN